MINEILTAIKTMIENNSSLTAYHTSGNLDIGIYDYDLQSQIDDELADTRLHIMIKFVDIENVSTETYGLANEYILSGKIEITENVPINRAISGYITGLQAAEYAFASILNAVIPADSSANTNNFYKITPINLKNDPKQNLTNGQKDELLRYWIDFKVKGFVQAGQHMMTYGKACIYGVNLNLTMIGLYIPGNFINIGADFTDEFNKTELLDANGDCVGVKVSNQRGNGVITFIPVGSTSSNKLSTAQGSIKLPNPYSVIWLTNGPSIINGYWNYTGGGTIRQIKDDFTVMTLPIIRYNKIDSRNLSSILQRS